MKRVLITGGVLVCLAARPAILHAHPGHDHWQEVRSWKMGGPAPPSPEKSAPGRPRLLAAAAVLGAMGSAAIIFERKLTERRLLLAPLAIAAAAVLAVLGCGGHRGENISAKYPQARHDTKQLERIFGHFKADNVALRLDDDYFYVESNAFPRHPMMVGITAWQQQVPLPQPYTGRNAWRIPLRPVVSDSPISAKTALYRGAVALAVNGVPIFNALNNRGEDAYLSGELDDYGGHCGRGDDYHYHIAPVHLEEQVGKGQPIAYGLDGFPIYGYTDAEGNYPTDLDEFNGRFEEDGSYRYYSTKKYPYINGGMRGVVTVRGDQIEPQPRDAPARPPGAPLRGAKITGFERHDDEKTYFLTYVQRGNIHTVRYTIGGDDSVAFVFRDDKGKQTTANYRRRARP